jgi:competence protein ComEC
MLLAERSTIPDELTQQFRRTGVSHVLAISGLHISLIAGMLWFLLSALPVSSKVSTLALVGLLFSYVFFIGAPASAVRAASFWSLVLIAYQLRVLVSLPTVFLLAATITATLKPQVMQDVGWQLSFSAVAGIFLTLFMFRRLQIVNVSWLKHIQDLGLVSVGAVLGTLPISVYHFGAISTIGVIANIFVVPVIPIVLVLSILMIVFGLLLPILGIALGSVIHFLFLWLDFITATLEKIPGSYLKISSFPVWAISVYYLATVTLAIYWMKRTGRSWREVWQ